MLITENFKYIYAMNAMTKCRKTKCFTNENVIFWYFHVSKKLKRLIVKPVVLGLTLMFHFILDLILILLFEMM